MALTLGIDVACRAAHQATLAADGKTVWRGRKFWTRPADLERLWDDLDLEDPAELTVVVEPTRNAWIVVAEWFRRRGATVVMVPTTQSSDLRKYYSKHTKNDRIDSELLARLPLLHPLTLIHCHCLSQRLVPNPRILQTPTSHPRFNLRSLLPIRFRHVEQVGVQIPANPLPLIRRVRQSRRQPLRRRRAIRV